MSDIPPPDDEKEVVIPVAGLPPSDMIDRVIEQASAQIAASGASAAGTQPHRHPVGIGLLIANTILIFSLFFVRASDRRILTHDDRIQKDGIACLLADLDDHRHTNQYAHDKLAEFDHIEINQPDVIPLTPAQAQALKSLCNEFIKSGTSSLSSFHAGDGPTGAAQP
jgi:hypothetical protein